MNRRRVRPRRLLSDLIQDLAVARPEAAPRAPNGSRRGLGASRGGRRIEGWVLGGGKIHLSLIAGCHADEPVGPAMLRRLAEFLASRSDGDLLLRDFTWYLVPHANPDGEARNSRWSDKTIAIPDHTGAPDRGYDLAAYLRQVDRERPGDDIEFGFPRDRDDLGARPENRAVAEFLRPGAPFDLHASFHGMAFAPGPWFLIEADWADRSAAMRRRLRSRVAAMGYRPFDVDRQGEKGFLRIDEGFSTRPDSRAMVAFFEQRGDPETAAKFRPSSMEFVRALGGDPFTMVSEMPLFLLPDPHPSDSASPPLWIPGKEGKDEFWSWLGTLMAQNDADGFRSRALAAGLRPMPIRDQMSLQLGFLEEALAMVG